MRKMKEHEELKKELKKKEMNKAIQISVIIAAKNAELYIGR